MEVQPRVFEVKKLKMFDFFRNQGLGRPAIHGLFEDDPCKLAHNTILNNASANCEKPLRLCPCIFFIVAATLWKQERKARTQEASSGPYMHHVAISWILKHPGTPHAEPGRLLKIWAMGKVSGSHNNNRGNRRKQTKQPSTTIHHQFTLEGKYLSLK